MDFTQLLHYVKRVGGLTTSDLATLLDRPIPTVRSWDKDKRVPKELTRDEMRKRLLKLKAEIDELPPNVSLINPLTSDKTRAGIVRAIRDELFGLSTTDTA